MRLATLAALLAASAGCRRVPPEPPAELVEVAQAPVRPLLIGPGTWADPARLPLRVTLPSGWAVWPGTGGGEVARLRGREGVEILLLKSDRDDPRPLSDCAWVSHDRVGRHRDVPALSPASLATCAPVEPDGPTVLAWIGEIQRAFIHVEVHLRAGELVRGRDEAAAVLGSMTAISVGDAGTPR